MNSADLKLTIVATNQKSANNSVYFWRWVCVIVTQQMFATLQPCSQFSAEQHIGQFALPVALGRVIVFVKVDVIKVYLSCHTD